VIATGPLPVAVQRTDDVAHVLLADGLDANEIVAQQIALAPAAGAGSTEMPSADVHGNV
jgi:hypothetical protein